MNTIRKYKTLLIISNLKKSIGTLLFLQLLGIQLAPAQSAIHEYQVKAVFLYNFTQFVEWPSTAFKSKDDPFVIGILGNDPFGSYLKETVQGEKIMDRSFDIQHFRDLKEIQHCHILFINTGDSRQIRETLTTLAQHNTLTVSDTGNFVQLGGMIRFFIKDNKIKLQINPDIAKSAGLNISSKLLRVADISH